MKKFLPFLILFFLVFPIAIGIANFSLSSTLKRAIPRAWAQTITVSAVVDEHLSWRQEGDNLVISTNKTEGFILQTANGVITKKGPVVLTVPASKSFILVSGY